MTISAIMTLTSKRKIVCFTKGMFLGRLKKWKHTVFFKKKHNKFITYLCPGFVTRFMGLYFVILLEPRLINLNSTSLPVDAEFIGRPSRWGNPFKLSHYSRNDAIRLYEEYLFKSGLIKKLHLLKFKVLACFCHPSPCHGDVLLKHLAKLELP